MLDLYRLDLDRKKLANGWCEAKKQVSLLSKVIYRTFSKVTLHRRGQIDVNTVQVEFHCSICKYKDASMS